MCYPVLFATDFFIFNSHQFLSCHICQHYLMCDSGWSLLSWNDILDTISISVKEISSFILSAGKSHYFISQVNTWNTQNIIRNNLKKQATWTSSV